MSKPHKPTYAERRADFNDALEEVRLALRQTLNTVSGSEAQADLIKWNLIPAVKSLQTVIEDHYPGKLTDHIT